VNRWVLAASDASAGARRDVAADVAHRLLPAQLDGAGRSAGRVRDVRESAVRRWGVVLPKPVPIALAVQRAAAELYRRVVGRSAARSCAARAAAEEPEALAARLVSRSRLASQVQQPLLAGLPARLAAQQGVALEPRVVAAWVSEQQRAPGELALQVFR